jgi:hypothetical protein
MQRYEAILERLKPEQEVRWPLVQMIVEGYAERHPEDVALCAAYVKKLRAQKADQRFAEISDSSQMRHLYELPEKLSMALNTVFPRLFTDEKNVHQFLKMYAIFRIPEKL